MSWRESLKSLATPGTKVALSEIPIGGAAFVGPFVITQPTAGDYRAFVRNCPHQGRQVDSIDESGIHCPAHGSTFDPGTGQPLTGPACRALKQATLKIVNDQAIITR